MDMDNTGFGNDKGKGKGKGGGKGGSGGRGGGQGDTICRDFAHNGQCRFGTQCRFRHGNGGAATDTGGSVFGSGAKGGGTFGGGYAPNSPFGGGYASNSPFGGGYASNSPCVNPMGQPQAYTPQQQAYLPQQQAYPPQQQAYSPQQQAYPPPQQAWAAWVTMFGQNPLSLAKSPRTRPLLHSLEPRRCLHLDHHAAHHALWYLH